MTIKMALNPVKLSSLLHITQGLNIGNSPEQRKHSYRQLILQSLGERTIKATRRDKHYALGNARFTAEIEAMLKRRASPGKVGRPRAKG